MPSTLAIEGLVNVNQMGATLFDVRSELVALWLLAAFYAGIAVLVELSKRRRDVFSSRPHAQAAP